MAYDINAALERLENNLAEVESAKKQVEKTIATSESLQQIIGRYTNTLNAMGKISLHLLKRYAIFKISIRLNLVQLLMLLKHLVNAQ